MSKDYSSAYSSIRQFIEQSEVARHSIVETSHGVGYIIPTDAMREAAGSAKIPLSEIYLWLYKRPQALLIFTTISTNFIELMRFILDDIPDCEVQWEYDASNPESGIEKLSDSFHNNRITHTYSETKEHTIALFSPSKLDALSQRMFQSNTYVKGIKATPVVNTINYMAFSYCGNLEKVDLDTGNVQFMNADSIFQCNKLLSIDLPDSVTSLGGWDTFYCPLEHFGISEKSNLEHLWSGCIFNFQDGPSIKDQYIYLPSRIKMYADGSTTENPILVTYDNVDKWINNLIPVSRCGNRIKIGKDALNTPEASKTDRSPYYTNDENGLVYVKDGDGNKRILVNVPYYDIFGSTGDILPRTVEYIAAGALMNICTRCGRRINPPTTRTIPFHIPSTIKYISPKAVYWSWQDIKFTSACKYYPTTKYGGLMTYSNFKDADDGKEPDVLLYEPWIGSYASYADRYEFPKNFSSFKDSKNSTWFGSTFCIYSRVKTMVLNSKFPRLPYEITQETMFANNPRYSFEADGVSENYTIYDGCLYMKDIDPDGSLNHYYWFIAAPKEMIRETLKVHDKCRRIFHGAFYGNIGFTNLDLNNVENAVTYIGFSYMQNIKTIRFGNSTKDVGGWEVFHTSSMETIVVGSDKSSRLQTFGNTAMCLNNYNLKNIWIYSVVVNHVNSDIIATNMGNDIDIHIYFYNEDGTYTTTYQSFVSAGFSPERSTLNRVRLVNID